MAGTSEGARLMWERRRAKFGQSGGNKPRPTQVMAERFDQYVSPEPNSGCHLWTGTIGKDGYGKIEIAGKTVRAHRVAWEMARGSIAGDAQVLHRCDMPLCVNPDHLRLGTHLDNMADRDAKGRFPSGRAGVRVPLNGWRQL